MLSLDALCHDRLYFSDPNKFNGLLDCMPAVINDSDKLTLRNILIAMIEKRVAGEVTNSLKAAKVEGGQALINPFITIDMPEELLITLPAL
ncbi:hypothetical protein [Gynuella sp.]|uniref:hypothetical protein n=1 Tax=Gynuella sp. TaxID=2969146 RepID=UPI003D11AFB6